MSEDTDTVTKYPSAARSCAEHVLTAQAVSNSIGLNRYIRGDS